MYRVRGVLIAAFLLLFAGFSAYGQVYSVTYRPPEARYLEFRSEHFTLIYQAGREEDARELAGLLEAALPATRALVGLRRRLAMPVVLNGYNDRANGFVTPMAFRQEIDGTRLRGNTLSPRASSWMEEVGPHELTHAAHAESGRGIGVGWLIRPFAPDVSRAINFMGPPGITEGAAVYFETAHTDGGGRLDYSLFNMRFRAAAGSGRPWSLAQMLESPLYTRPFDRFYHGGAYLFRYMAEQDSTLRFFPRSRGFFYRMPLAGYGTALWYGTGIAPHLLGRRMRREFVAREAARIAASGPFTQPHVVASAPGLEHRMPRWIDDETLLVYAQGYDVRRGFYRIDARTGRRSLAGHHQITEDYFYSFDHDSSAILFARYVTDPVAPVKAVSEIYRMDLAAGSARRLTRGGRASSPVPARGGAIWTLRNDGQFNQWAILGTDGEVIPLTGYHRVFFRHLAPSPDGGEVAVLLNVGGRQGIFRADEEQRLQPWVLFEDASIFDVAWSADSRYLVFSADPEGVANIFALDIREDRVVRLTNMPYGAIEPSLSPDGRTIAFADYRHERFDLVTMPFEPAAAEEIPRERTSSPGFRWNGAGVGGISPDGPRAGDSGSGRSGMTVPGGPATPAAEIPTTEPAPYRALRHLRPRMFTPLIYADDLGKTTDAFDLGFGGGVAVAGGDPLERWAYDAGIFFQRGRPWGSLAVASGRYVFRPTLRVFAQPSLVNVLRSRPELPSDTLRLGRDERAIAAGIRLPITLSSNVFRSQATFAVEGTYRTEDLFDDEGTVEGGRRASFSLNPAAALAYRVQSNIRDLVPNTGLVLRAAGRIDTWEERGLPSRHIDARADLYLPFLLNWNGGVRLHAGVLWQNRGGIVDIRSFLPRGYEDERVFLGEGTFFRYGAELVQPLRFVDNGFLIVPAYLSVLYAYGFAEALAPSVDAPADFASAGGGLGARVKLFHVFNFDLRFGGAFQFSEKRWKPINR